MSSLMTSYFTLLILGLGVLALPAPAPAPVPVPAFWPLPKDGKPPFNLPPPPLPPKWTGHGKAPAAAATPSPAGSAAAPLVTNWAYLRVEAENNITVWEWADSTYAHNVSTALGGIHHCDGTNNGVNQTPGPTAGGILADAYAVYPLSWDGPYNPATDDYIITSIGGYSAPAGSTDTWDLIVNQKFPSTTPCQTQINAGDEVIWALGAKNRKYILQLFGPQYAQHGTIVQYQVIDNKANQPVAGAGIFGALGLSDSNGYIYMNFTENQLGWQIPKAYMANAVPSSFVATYVY